MNGDLLDILPLALLAACYPTLLAAVTVMLLLPNPKRLMLGYLLGAYTTSIALGLVFVFTRQDSAAATTSKHTISPAADIAVGLILLLIAYVLASGRAEAARARRRERKEAKEPSGDEKEEKDSWTQRALGSGSARTTYAVGVVLSFPGVTYLTALHRIADLDAATGPTVLLVVGFCLMQLVLLEVPLLGYALAPERTQVEVDRFRSWLSRNGMRIAVIVAAVLGALLVVRGFINLL